MASAPVVIDLLGGSDDDDRDGPRSARAASGRAASGLTPERRALAQSTAPLHKRRDAPDTRRGGGGAAGADVAQGPVPLIDLTGDDDAAMNAAFRAWEVIDLTGDECAAGAPAQPAAAPADVLAQQRARIAAFLRSSHCKALRVQRCDANPHAAPGRPLYERFAAALERVDDKRVELCFHGTPEVNVDSILRNGLDPKRRKGQALGKGEYFGKNADVSLAYCRGGRKMLVFACLRDASGVTADQPNVMVVHRPEHQLPLFVITCHDGARHPGQPKQPPSHVLRRVEQVSGGTGPPPACCSCAARLQRADLAVARTFPGCSRHDLYHLRCAAAAHFAGEMQLQAMLQECAARSYDSASYDADALGERDLAQLYDELGSDARRAPPELPKPAKKARR